MEEKEIKENGKKGVSEWGDNGGEGGDGETGKGRSVTLKHDLLFTPRTSVPCIR